MRSCWEWPGEVDKVEKVEKVDKVDKGIKKNPL